MRHDPDELVLVVDDRDGDEPVLRHLLGDELLVVVDPDRDDPRVHDVRQDRPRFGLQQPPERQEADQVAFLVGDVDVVDRFAVGACSRSRSIASMAVILAGGDV